MKRLITIVLTILMLTTTAAAQEVVAGGIDGRGGLSYKKIVNVDDDGRMVGRQKIIDGCDATTGWACINDDCSGLSTDLDHTMGTTSLEIDKVDGTANTVFGVIQKTLTSLDLSTLVENGGMLMYSLNVSDTTDIAYCLIRLGTSASHYNEWRVDDSQLVTGWQTLRFNVDRPSTAGATGNGWNPTAVTYIAIGCAFDLETDALADMRFDHIVAYSGQYVSADTNATAGTATPKPSLLTLDDDRTGQCIAIPAAEVDYTIPATAVAVEFAAHGGTAYVLCAAAAPVAATTAVGGHSIVVQDGQTIGPYPLEVGGVCSVIGAVAIGELCIHTLY